MVSVVVNTVVNLDYRMRPLWIRKKKKKQVGSAGNSGRLQHPKPREIHGKTRGKILKRKTGLQSKTLAWAGSRR